MKVLVTGSQGYLGTVLCDVFRRAGIDVVGLDLGLFADCVLGPPPTEVPCIRKDVRDVEAADLAGFDAVVHLAALSNDPLGDLSPAWTQEINHAGAVRTARAARAAGVARFVFASSCSLYGARGDALLTERDPLAPLTPYALSKARAETDLAALADDRFSPVLLRNATLYGFSPRFRADLVVNNLACWAHTTGAVRVMSDGMAWRPLLHVEDAARAFLEVVRAPRETVHNAVFNVGVASQNCRVREIATTIGEALPGSRVTFAPSGGTDPRNYRVDFSRLAAAFPAFRPLRDVRRGAEEVLDACRRHGLSADRFPDGPFTRLHRIRDLLGRGALDASFRLTRHE